MTLNLGSGSQLCGFGLVVVLLSGCVAAGSGAGEDLAPAIVDCGDEHAWVGATAELETHFHDVAGTATILDDCTIEITGFTFDGEGLDVRAVVSDDPEFGQYDVLSDNLLGEGPYADESLTLSLREGMTLDGVRHVSIWCVPAGVSFGDGSFVAP